MVGSKCLWSCERVMLVRRQLPITPSKRLFKDISSLQVVMDGSARPESPRLQCVCVCMHLHVRGEDIAKCSAAPSSPPPVCALPSRQPYVRSPLCKCATWLQNLPNLPCLKEMKQAAECRGRSQLEKSDCQSPKHNPNTRNKDRKRAELQPNVSAAKGGKEKTLCWPKSQRGQIFLLLF